MMQLKTYSSNNNNLKFTYWTTVKNKQKEEQINVPFGHFYLIVKLFVS